MIAYIIMVIIHLLQIWFCIWFANKQKNPVYLAFIVLPVFMIGWSTMGLFIYDIVEFPK